MDAMGENFDYRETTSVDDVWAALGDGFVVEIQQLAGNWIAVHIVNDRICSKLSNTPIGYQRNRKFRIYDRLKPGRYHSKGWEKGDYVTYMHGNKICFDKNGNYVSTVEAIDGLLDGTWERVEPVDNIDLSCVRCRSHFKSPVDGAHALCPKCREDDEWEPCSREDAEEFRFSNDCPGAKHWSDWYPINERGKGTSLLNYQYRRRKQPAPKMRRVELYRDDVFGGLHFDHPHDSTVTWTHTSAPSVKGYRGYKYEGHPGLYTDSVMYLSDKGVLTTVCPEDQDWETVFPESFWILEG